jgi:Tfp pilus assembly protein PilF
MGAGRKRIATSGALLVLLVVTTACAPQEDTAAQEVSTLLTKALNAQSAGNPSLATAYYYDVLERDPRNAIAYFNLGTIAEERSDYAEAEDNFRVALSVNPGFTLARTSLERVETVSR